MPSGPIRLLSGELDGRSQNQKVFPAENCIVTRWAMLTLVSCEMIISHRGNGNAEMFAGNWISFLFSWRRFTSHPVITSLLGSLRLGPFKSHVNPQPAHPSCGSLGSFLHCKIIYQVKMWNTLDTSSRECPWNLQGSRFNTEFCVGVFVLLVTQLFLCFVGEDPFKFLRQSCYIWNYNIFGLNFFTVWVFAGLKCFPDVFVLLFLCFSSHSESDGVQLWWQFVFLWVIWTKKEKKNLW